MIDTPIVVAVIGEGGSGGALAIGVGDRVLMLQHSIYSVISPESCSAILWKNQDHAQEAAESLKLTAQNLLELGIIDEIVEEPPGGAHADPEQAAHLLKERLAANIALIEAQPAEQRLSLRYDKFRRIGTFISPETTE